MTATGESIDQYIGTSKTYRLVLNNLQGGWSTRSFPHQIRDNQLSVLDNFAHERDNIWTVRPGNINYGSGSGQTGSGVASLAATRFYFGASTITGQLCVQSGGHLYTGNDTTGAFTSVGTGMSTTQPATFAQMYDPDNLSGANTTLFICDGSRTPRRWDGTNFAAVQQGGVFLPNGVQSGSPITPLYATDWNYSLCYANEPTDQTALWISDQLRPERFTATAITDTAGSTYIPYYPGGKNSALGAITGIRQYGAFLIVFFTAGVVTAVNTGSYGAFQYIFTTISRNTGCTSPRSIVAMDYGIIFFGGDRFYVTDGFGVYPLPDEVPTLYSTDNISSNPPEIANATTVIAARNALTYMAGYETTSGSGQSRIATFDTQANGGWQYTASSGGAWARYPSGMPMAWGVSCRGPGDAANMFPFFWGSSQGDVVAQYDPPGGPTTDFGNPIVFDIRSKSFYLEAPASPKTIQGFWPLIVVTTFGNYTFTLSPYVIFDNGAIFSYTPIVYTVSPSGITYGQQTYGSFKYAAAQVYELFTKKSYPDQNPTPVGFSFALGLNGSTTNTFNVIGVECDLTLDNPET